MRRPLMLAILLCALSMSALAFQQPRIAPQASSPNAIVSLSLPAAIQGPGVRRDLKTRVYVQTPVVSSPIPDQSHRITAGVLSIDLSTVFSDTEENNLTFSAASNKEEIATVSISGNVLSITPVAIGNCRIRTTAKDDGNGKADDTFTLTIRENLPPALAPLANLDNKTLEAGGSSLTLDLLDIFQDPDDDQLSFSAESSNKEFVEVSLNENVLTLTPNRTGESTVMLSANDQNGGILLESFTVEVIEAYLAFIEAGVFVPFADYQDQGNYKMIALPGNQSVALKNVTPGEFNEDWVAFAPKPSSAGALVPYDDSDLFTFTPGNGLWFLSKTDLFISPTSIPTVPLSDTRSFRIALHPGWNIISNPLDLDIPWAAVAASNGISQGIWHWDNGYILADAFLSTANAQVAFYYNNLENRAYLDIPYQPESSETNETVFSNKADISQTLSITARGVVGGSAGVRLLLAPDASGGFDAGDMYTPPPHFNAIDFAIRPAHVDFQGRALAVESRPLATETHQFDLTLKGQPGSFTTLHVEGIDAFPEDRVVLVNRLDTQTFDLHQRQDFQLYLQQEETPLQIIIGQTEAVAQRLASLKPSLLALKQNYPNPFSPLTTIEFALPSPGYVELSVFDLMGRHIVTLVQGQKESGLHHVQWHGFDSKNNRVANGVYFYRLLAGASIRSRKMTLVR